MKRNIRLVLSYDGTRYQGWQRQVSSDNTIQGKLETTLSRILQEPICVFGSGRTDAGVHARGQVANFFCDSEMPCADLLSELRRYLPEDLGVESCKEASPRFHARLNAREKTYRYRIWNSDSPCVFDRRYVYVFPQELDVPAMERAAGLLLGTHDFGAFCAHRKTKKSTVRTLRVISIYRVNKEVQIVFTGDGFLHNMVRILVGTLLEVGTGVRSAESVAELFEKRRQDSGFLAPAKGLCLEEVVY